MNGLKEIVETYVWWSPFAVLFAGILTASNPCVLAVVPLMIGAAGAYQGEKTNYKRSVIFTLIFVLGLVLAFSILGVITALIGSSINLTGSWVYYFLAAVCIVMGLMFADIISVNIPVPQVLKKPQTGLFGAFVLGLLFGFVSTPCAAPILVILMALVGTGSAGNIVWGSFLFFVYALGHSAMILAVGMTAGSLQAYINNKGFSKISGVLRVVFGLLIVIVGLYLLYLA
ncbi:MAG TPA: cytochrome c biogenesis protein CcdA [Caldisericia bacterium]|nr:cytochrome c biogenesis protein CcdA [Caldisericia bacterium]HPF48562.1 cytochrome c biogenesis protein CcdA [Caldisericia bacterium]HPI83778.1 cytochrome c biogenesis protein CcdA [Caldisericia bacterium]HPQ93017.1 cytochrome c biogenesis protein CcdA [Caldisericia bacterium]HRV75150.1 cytochrome c biogenesis protein CcdA [Caldisericia bacterium]